MDDTYPFLVYRQGISGVQILSAVENRFLSSKYLRVGLDHRFYYFSVDRKKVISERWFGFLSAQYNDYE